MNAHLILGFFSPFALSFKTCRKFQFLRGDEDWVMYPPNMSRGPRKGWLPRRGSWCSQAWDICPDPPGLTAIATGLSSLHPKASSGMWTPLKLGCFEPSAFSSETELLFLLVGQELALVQILLCNLLFINKLCPLSSGFTSPHDLSTKFSRIQSFFFFFSF